MKTGLQVGLVFSLLSCIALTACGRSVEPAQNNVDEYGQPIDASQDHSQIASGESAADDGLNEPNTNNPEITAADTEPNRNIATAYGPSSAQIKRLEENGLPTVLPSPAPAGFELVDFEVTSGALGIDYRADYEGANNCGFVVSGGTGGWGAPGTIRQWTVQTPLFGEVILEEGELGAGTNSLGASITPDPELGKAALPGYPLAGYIFNFSCEYGTFSPEQAADILTSMDIVK